MNVLGTNNIASRYFSLYLLIYNCLRTNFVLYIDCLLGELMPNDVAFILALPINSRLILTKIKLLVKQVLIL